MESVLFPKGMLVEVGSDDDCFKDVWYIATIIETPFTSNPTSTNNNNNPDSDKYLIEYKSLLDDDGSSPLREPVKPEFVRPLSPIPSEADDLAHSFSLYEVVDAFFHDGWWTGVITRVIDDDTFAVAFEFPPDVFEFRIWDVRAHRSWIDGKWVRPNQRRTSKSVFRAGTMVDASADRNDCGDVWFPATFVEDLGNESFMAECQTIGGNNSNSSCIFPKETADLWRIVSSPIYLIKDMGFELWERVDVSYKLYWWNGVTISELAAGTMCIVYFQEMEFNHSDPRPNERNEGKQTAPSLEIIIASHGQEDQVQPHCISANDSNKTAAEYVTSLDYGENQTFESTPCNGKPSSYGMASVRKITKPKMIAGIDDASQPWPSEKLHGDAPNAPFLNTCVLNTSMMASAEASCLQQSTINSDQFAAKTWSHTSTRSKRKRARPRKSPQLGDADHLLLVTVAGSIESSNGPARSKRETAKRLELSVGKAMQISSKQLEKSSPNRGQNVLSFSRQAMQSANARCLRQSVDIDDRFAAKTWSHKDPAQLRNDTSIARKKRRPRKSQQLGDADVFVTTCSDSKEHSKRATCQTVKKCPAKGLGLSIGKRMRTSNKQFDDVADPNRGLAFARSSPLWQMIDCMEVFRLMPQNPHFAPLKTCIESCREGLAIGCMVTFSSVVKKIYELRFDDPRSCIKENLGTLRELESQGFDVKMLRDRLNGLLLIKDKHELLQDKIVERRATAEKTKTGVDEIDEISNRIRELREKRALAILKKKVQDSDIAFLKSSEESVEEGMISCRDGFGKLATAAWVMSVARPT